MHWLRASATLLLIALKDIFMLLNFLDVSHAHQVASPAKIWELALFVIFLINW